MTKLAAYFHTEWEAMTATDWFGLIFTVVIFILMVVVYVWALNPKNKDRIESHRTMLLDENENKLEK